MGAASGGEGPSRSRSDTTVPCCPRRQCADGVPRAFLGDEAGVLGPSSQAYGAGRWGGSGRSCVTPSGSQGLQPGPSRSFPNLAKPLIEFLFRFQHRPGEETARAFGSSSAAAKASASSIRAGKALDIFSHSDRPRCERASAIVCGVSTVGLVTIRSPPLLADGVLLFRGQLAPGRILGEPLLALLPCRLPIRVGSIELCPQRFCCGRDQAAAPDPGQREAAAR